MEGLYVELKIHKSKWIVNCSYNPHKISISNTLLAISDSLNLYSSTYNKIVILGDLNLGTEDNHIKIFCGSYNLKGLIKQPTSYKNPDNLTYIDSVLTNVPRSFQRKCVLEIGIYIFNLMPLTVMRKRFKKFHSR